MAPRERTAEAGFVLFLAIISIALFAIAALSVQQAVSLQRMAISRFDAKTRFAIGVANAQARISYILLTQPMGPQGPLLGADRNAVAEGVIFDQTPSRRGQDKVLALDDRPYALRAIGVGPIEVRLQDAAGLINVNEQTPNRLQRLAQLSGQRVSDAARLAAVLLDYIDEDDLPRPGGAERLAYERLGLRPPANAPLTDVRQALGAVDFYSGRPLNDDIFEYASAYPQEIGINVNTAPELVIEAAIGADKKMARNIIRERSRRAFQSSDDLIERTGVALDPADGGVSARPADRIRLSFASQNAGKRAFEQRVLVLTLDDRKQPFFVTPGLPMKKPREINDAAIAPLPGTKS